MSVNIMDEESVDSSDDQDEDNWNSYGDDHRIKEFLEGQVLSPMTWEGAKVAELWNSWIEPVAPELQNIFHISDEHDLDRALFEAFRNEWNESFLPARDLLMASFAQETNVVPAPGAPKGRFLRELHLSNSEFRTRESSVSLIDFLTAVGTELTSLAFVRCQFTSVLLEGVARLPSVDSLKICCRDGYTIRAPLTALFQSESCTIRKLTMEFNPEWEPDFESESASEADEQENELEPGSDPDSDSDPPTNWTTLSACILSHHNGLQEISVTDDEMTDHDLEALVNAISVSSGQTLRKFELIPSNDKDESNSLTTRTWHHLGCLLNACHGLEYMIMGSEISAPTRPQDQELGKDGFWTGGDPLDLQNMTEFSGALASHKSLSHFVMNNSPHGGRRDFLIKMFDGFGRNRSITEMKLWYYPNETDYFPEAALFNPRVHVRLNRVNKMIGRIDEGFDPSTPLQLHACTSAIRRLAIDSATRIKRFSGTTESLVRKTLLFVFCKNMVPRIPKSAPKRASGAV